MLLQDMGPDGRDEREEGREREMHALDETRWLISSSYYHQYYIRHCQVKSINHHFGLGNLVASDLPLSLTVFIGLNNLKIYISIYHYVRAVTKKLVLC